ncbi:CatB-related O-acetyltransferase [Desulfotomaculum sp. 1211_IL3151]|uniref:CatB-related O-acetyltransferase n=1 Tax=Desulfotomaculum sp. 1211_IL3151 TaxID=3084055 RepID=UPI002FD91E27
MMMNFSVQPKQITDITTVMATIENNKPQFPLMVIDRDSFIVSCEIQSGINFDTERIAHNLHIGKYCSFADKIKFMLSLNHDYKRVTTGACSFLSDVTEENVLKQHNQIIIQNDVWLGSGVTIMSGVTVHNGAVIAANSHVVSDVPPYAIVGGNPATIIKYRFAEEQIKKLLKISWWLWDIEKLQENKKMFTKRIDEFIERFYEEPATDLPSINYKKTKPIILMFPDLDASYSLTEYIIQEFCRRYGDTNEAELVMYLNYDDSVPNEVFIRRYMEEIDSIVVKLGQEKNENIVLLIDNLPDERPLFQISDYYITTRAQETVRRTCYADMYGVKVVSGVDKPIF